jgi:hypothetical protein
VLFYLSLQLQFRIEVISYSMKSNNNNNVKHNVQNDAMVQNLLRVMATAQATLLTPA